MSSGLFFKYLILTLISVFPSIFPGLCSDGAHDGDNVSGRTSGVRPKCPSDLWSVRR